MNDDRQKKIRLMQIAVVIIVGIILVIWIGNIKNVWRFNNVNFSSNEEELNWSEIKNGFNKTIIDAKSSFQADQQKQIREVGQVFIDDLIEETEKLAASSSENNISSPSSGLDCPLYIDCMPTIIDSSSPVKEVRSCQVPIGCEEITQIVY